MTDAPIAILLVENNPVEAGLLRGTFAGMRAPRCTLQTASCLEEAFASLEAGHFDLVLLDLSLPESSGLETFLRLQHALRETPVIVLVGDEEEMLAVSAVQLGAQEYLFKSEVNGRLLIRAIRNAIARHRTQCILLSMSLLDDLTGLYNHRGFFMLAEQQLKISSRAQRSFALVFADVDELKQINDDYGHQQGDRALIATAELLRGTFRASDILARIGGDEFVIMVVDVAQDAVEGILQRLQVQMYEYNRAHNGHPLSLSLGVVYSDCRRPVVLRELLTSADTLMYEQKRGKRQQSRISA